MERETDLRSGAAAIRKAGLTPEQQAARKANDARSEAIQAAALRPPDGVTFGKRPKAER